MKISRFFMPLMAGLLLVSCGSKTEYTLNVNLNDELVGSTVYLTDYITGQVLDSAKAETTSVVFKGEAPETRIATVKTDRYYGICFLEPGSIYLDPITDSLSGTPLNEAFFKAAFSPELKKAIADCNAAYEKYQQAAQAGDAEALIKQLDPVLDSLIDRYENMRSNSLKELYEGNKDNLLGAFVLSDLAQDFQSSTELEKALEGASDVVRNFPPIQKIAEMLIGIDRTSPGRPFIDLKGINFATGQEETLSNMIQGKLALVDFWASWCGPCKAEIKENLVRLYKEYSKKGLVIVGVDVWEREEGAHAKAVEALGIEYPQLIDSKNEAGNLYGFNAIPQIILISPEGTILARDLRGDEIEKAIVENLVPVATRYIEYYDNDKE